jgi:hypothetical protein
MAELHPEQKRYEDSKKAEEQDGKRERGQEKNTRCGNIPVYL